MNTALNASSASSRALDQSEDTISGTSSILSQKKKHFLNHFVSQPVKNPDWRYQLWYRVSRGRCRIIFSLAIILSRKILRASWCYGLPVSNAKILRKKMNRLLTFASRLITMKKMVCWLALEKGKKILFLFCLEDDRLAEQSDTKPRSLVNDEMTRDRKASELYQRAVVTDEFLRDRNKYYCEECQRYNEARRSVSYRRLPRLLTLQLKRFSSTFGWVLNNYYCFFIFTEMRFFCGKLFTGRY